MRADLERIKKMIVEHEDDLKYKIENGATISSIELAKENAILRELLTSWQAMNSHEYQSDARLHLNMLTKRMLQDKPREQKED